jgi:hypothetical protein
MLPTSNSSRNGTVLTASLALSAFDSSTQIYIKNGIPN